MSLEAVIIVLVLVCLVIWLVNDLPIDAKLKQIVTVLVVVAVILWLLSMAIPHFRTR